MKKTARVIVTYRCDRNCPGCCNSKPHDVRLIVSHKGLMEYDEIVITGGEPLLEPVALMQFIKKLKRQNRFAKIFLYTARTDADKHKKIIGLLDGMTVTLHAECTDDDIRNLKYMSDNLDGEPLDLRLFVDKRVYKKYDLRNINFEAWDIVRKLKWKEECSPADNEDLLYFPLF